MAECRAVQVSHELWKQIMTQGYTSGGIQCIEGLPEDAKLFLVSLSYLGRGAEPVFVFESDSWTSDAGQHTVRLGGEIYPLIYAVFRTAECRTCEWWKEKRGNPSHYPHRIGACKMSDIYAEGKATFAFAGELLITDEDFGCTQYQPREADD